MINLFKKRNFSDLLSDSFSFFKLEGKHFFKNYFIVNGIFLLLLIVLSYFLFQVYFEALSSGMYGVNSNYSFADELLNENLPLIVSSAVFFAILMLFITLINFAYPVIYLKLYEKNNGNGFQIKDIANELKSKIGKMFLFFLLSLILILPLIIILFSILILLSFVLIGIPLLIISFPLLFSLMSLSLYDYLNNDNGFFSAIKTAFGYIFKQFWMIIGSTIIMYIIIQTVMTVISMIPYFIGMISIFSTLETSNDQEAFSALGILMIVIFIISILANYILHNLLMINQGMIYYSIREKIEHKSSYTDIDSIGNNFE